MKRTNLDSFESLRSRFEKIRKELSLKKSDRAYMEFTTEPKGDATPHIELNNGKFQFVVSERGTEYIRKTAKDENEVLYWLVCCLTRWIASDWEVRHRIPDSYSRIVWMNKEIEILNSLNPDWASLKFSEYKDVLNQSSNS